MSSEDPDIRARLVELDKLYAGTAKKREPHPDVGCWWTLYDYGLDVVKTWTKDYKHPYPGRRWALIRAHGRTQHCSSYVR